LRVVLYNIRYGTGAGWNYHLPLPFSGLFRRTEPSFRRLSAFIDGLAPDLVGLVEVDGGSYRHGGESQARCLAEHLSLDHFFSCKYGMDSIFRKVPVLSSQGNAILSRIPAIRTGKMDLARGMKRTLLEAEFEDFVFLLVHLPLGTGARRAQLENLARRVRQYSKPVLLGGDFNLVYGSGELGDFLSSTGLRDTDPLGRKTYPSRMPRFRLDFLLASPGIEIRDFEVPDVRFSDHLPLLCDFEISLPDRGKDSQ
jgi:endonuclease/exonuclease/phosphatase family metal-dependent hydrolase